MDHTTTGLIDLTTIIHRAMAELHNLSESATGTMAEAFKAKYEHYERRQFFLSSPGDMMLRTLPFDAGRNFHTFSDGSTVSFSATTGCTVGDN